MNALVAEYRTLPPGADARKVEIVRALDEDANQPDVSALLLDLLRDRLESGQARVEAVEVVGLYVDETSPQWRELFHELLRIHGDAAEAEILRGSVEAYAAWLGQALAD